MFIEVLTEGASDVPVVREVLIRQFGLSEHVDFRIHPHRGRGNLPANPLAQPDPKHRGLFDQLPAKLRGFGKYMDEQCLVLVLVDVDNDDCVQLLAGLKALLLGLPIKPPRVLFRLAIEETESWFLADSNAIKKAFPNAKLGLIQNIAPDARVGAWEKLAECLGHKPSNGAPKKTHWAEQIAPHLNFDTPFSPSLGKLISGLKRELN
ncbi:MAG: hypothetical protein EPN14_11860 [Gallionella sp.]|nr:MAG: hypothetical protein EPN14_11860 [Gallionella sp.]